MNLNAKFAIARYNTTYIVYRHLYAILQILHMFSKKEEVKSIGNPAGIGKGTGFGLRDRDRDGIGLGHYRLRANCGRLELGTFQFWVFGLRHNLDW